MYSLTQELVQVIRNLGSACNAIYFRFFAFLLVVLLPLKMQGQLAATIVIENQTVSGSDFLFDIYLVRGSAGPENIYLAASDFVLTYNNSNFNSPTIENVPGFCELTPSDHSGSNDDITRSNYFNNTVASLIGNLVVINLNGPSPNATTISTRVALVDEKLQVHRLGRFKITGIIDPGQGADLLWQIGGVGLTTFVSSFEIVAPFSANEINTVTGVVELCLATRMIDQIPIQDGKYQASSHINSNSSLANGVSAIFSAVDSIVLAPNFTLEAGALFEINLDGCDP